MAKLTITLFEIGDRVVVKGGSHDGAAGTVTAWGHIGSREPNVVHHVLLDVPLEHKVETTSVDAGKTIVTTEVHKIDSLEVPVSELVAG